MKFRWAMLIAGAGLLTACSGLLQNRVPEADVYQLAPTPIAAGAVTHDVVLRLARPSARPGLDTDHWAVTLADQRRDVYANVRWAAPLPRMAEGLLMDALRATAFARAVVPDHSPFQGRYLLQTDITEFTADYTAGNGPPIVRVTLSGEIGIPSEHRLLSTVSGTGSARATADRRRDVMAAYQSAWDQAVAQWVQSVNSALARAEQP
jgi:ABC-type uncharacterized transport system auxiliary subunit